MTVHDACTCTFISDTGKRIGLLPEVPQLGPLGRGRLEFEVGTTVGLIDVFDVRSGSRPAEIVASIACPLVPSGELRLSIILGTVAKVVKLGETCTGLRQRLTGSDVRDALLALDCNNSWLVEKSRPGIDPNQYPLRWSDRASDAILAVAGELPRAVKRYPPREVEAGMEVVDFRSMYVAWRRTWEIGATRRSGLAASATDRRTYLSLVFARRHWSGSTRWRVNAGRMFDFIEGDQGDAVDVAVQMLPNTSANPDETFRYRVETTFGAPWSRIEDPWNELVARPVALAARIDGQTRASTLVPWLHGSAEPTDPATGWWTVYADCTAIAENPRELADQGPEVAHRSLSPAHRNWPLTSDAMRRANRFLMRSEQPAACCEEANRPYDSPRTDRQPRLRRLELPGTITSANACLALIAHVAPAEFDLEIPSELCDQGRIPRDLPDELNPNADRQDADVIDLARRDGFVARWGGARSPDPESAKLRLGGIEFTVSKYRSPQSQPEAVNAKLASSTMGADANNPGSRVEYSDVFCAGLGARAFINPRGKLFGPPTPPLPTLYVSLKLPIGTWAPATIVNTESAQSNALLIPPPASVQVPEDPGALECVEKITALDGQTTKISWANLDGGNEDNLHRREPTDSACALILRTHPFTALGVGVPQFRGALHNSVWTGTSWLLGNSDRVTFRLPPQVVGESAESGRTPAPKAKENASSPESTLAPALHDAFENGQLAQFRFPQPSFLEVSQTLGLRSQGAPAWDIDRLFGGSEAETVSPTLTTLTSEFLYGLAVRVRTPGVRVRELFARSGRLLPLPPRERYSGRNKQIAEEWSKFHARWAHLRASAASRPFALELFEERRSERSLEPGPDGRVPPIPELHLSDSVEWVARLSAPSTGNSTAFANSVRDNAWPEWARRRLAPALITDQFAPTPDKAAYPHHTTSGVTSGFVSKGKRDSLVASPVSDRGVLRNPRLTTLGGYADQRVVFNNGTTIIEATTECGRVSRYSVSVIGRIGVFWNRAKHVVVFERTVLPTPQMERDQDPHFGRAVLRMTEEYIEILQPRRDFPDQDADTTLNTACLRAIDFGEGSSVRIPVSHRWGYDVDSRGEKVRVPTDTPVGWQIPLWRPDADPFVYPRPSVRLCLAADPDGARLINCDINNPHNLRFWTRFASKGTSHDGLAATDLWPTHVNIDAARTAPADTDSLVDPPDTDPQLARFTFELNCPEDVDLAAGRQRSSCFSRPRNITVMRAAYEYNKPADPNQHDAVLALLKNAAIFAPRSHGISVALREGLADPGELPIQGDIETRKQAIGSWLAKRADAAVKLAVALTSVPAKTLDEEIEAALRKAKDWIDRAQKSIENFQSTTCASLADRDAAHAALTALLEQLLASAATELRSVQLRVDNVTDQAHQALGRAQAAIQEATDAAINRLTSLETRLTTAEQHWDDVTGRGTEAARAFCIDLLRDAEDTLLQVLRDLDSARDLVALVAAPLGGYAATISEYLADKIDHLNSAVKGTLRNLRDAASNESKTSDELNALVVGINHRTKEARVEFEREIKRLVSEVLDREAKMTKAASCLEWGAREYLKDGFDLLSNAPEHAARTLLQELHKERQNGTHTCESLTRKLLEAIQRLHSLVDTVSRNLSGLRLALDNSLAQYKDLIQELTVDLKGHLESVVAKVRHVLSEDEWKKWEGLTPPQSLAEAARSLDAAARTYAAPVADLARQALASLDLGRDFKRGIGEQSLALVRAFGPPPRVPGIDFNLKDVALSFRPGQPGIDLTPVKAYVNELGERYRKIDNALRPLGIELPTKEFLDRFTPDFNVPMNLEDVLRHIAGFPVFGLFPGVHIDESFRDAVKIDHQHDPATLSGRVKADVNLRLGSRTMIDAGPLQVHFGGAELTATSVLAFSGGQVQRTASGSISGRWALSIGGQELVAFPDTRIKFAEPGGIDFDIPVQRMELSSILRMLSDAVRFGNADKEGSGLFVGTVERDGIVSGVNARLALAVPSAMGGAAGYANLSLGAFIGLSLDRSSSGVECTIGMGFNVSSREKPFTIAIFFLGGAGYLDVSARYNPVRRTLATSVDLGIFASASASISLGPIEGGIFAYLGITAQYTAASNTPAQLSFSIVFIIRGEVTLLGFVRVGLMLMLELGYSVSGDTRTLYGRGTIEIRIKIGWFINIKIRRSIEYKKVSRQSQARATLDGRSPALARARYLNRVTYV